MCKQNTFLWFHIDEMGEYTCIEIVQIVFMAQMTQMTTILSSVPFNFCHAHVCTIKTCVQISKIMIIYLKL